MHLERFQKKSLFVFSKSLPRVHLESFLSEKSLKKLKKFGRKKSLQKQNSPGAHNANEQHEEFDFVCYQLI